jgi:hypothetical protein
MYIHGHIVALVYIMVFQAIAIRATVLTHMYLHPCGIVQNHVYEDTQGHKD